MGMSSSLGYELLHTTSSFTIVHIRYDYQYGSILPSTVQRDNKEKKHEPAVIGTRPSLRRTIQDGRAPDSMARGRPGLGLTWAGRSGTVFVEGVLPLDCGLLVCVMMGWSRVVGYVY